MWMSLLPDALVAQGHALVNTEAVLLVDDDKPELVKFDTFLEQCVRADDKLCAAIGNRLEGLAPRRCTLTASEPGRLDFKRPQPLGKTVPVLLGQQLGWCHDRGLNAAGDRLKTGYCCDHGFAGADVALDQSHHWMRLREIRNYLVDNTPLRVG